MHMHVYIEALSLSNASCNWHCRSMRAPHCRPCFDACSCEMINFVHLSFIMYAFAFGVAPSNLHITRVGNSNSSVVVFE